MSKFWGGADSSDSEDDVSDKELLSGSEGSEGSGDEGEGEGEKDIDWGLDSGSEEEGAKRVVKSVRDKRYEEMHKLIESLENDIKEANWVSINTDFQSLSVWIKKASNLISKEGVPGPYVSILIQLEDFLKQTSADKEAKKAMSKNDSKAFNTFAQKLKKNNKDFQADIDRFKQNPAAFNKAAVKTAKDEDEDDEEDEDENDDDLVSLAKPKKKAALSDDDEEDGETKPTKAGRKAAPAPAPAAKIVWTDELISEKLDEVVKKRGMKKATPKELIDQLKVLLANVKSAQKKVEIYMQVIAIMFDRTSANVTKAMKPGAWTRAREYIAELLQLLTSDTSLVLNETASAAAEETEDGSLPAVTQIAVNLTSFIEQLDTEFSKGLHHVDPHTHEYVDRLRQDSQFLDLAAQVQEYYEKHGDLAQAARIAMKRVEHSYYKHDTITEKLEEAHLERQQKEALRKKESPVDSSDDKKTPTDVEKLCVLVYTHGDERLKTNALLCHVYHHALHDRFHQARDLMLMSHIQDNIQHMDARMQVLFNRAMVQLGLCAFRKGAIYEAHSCLSDICSGKTREYLAQGMSSARFQEKSPEQEKLEKLRQVPFHMHINLDLLDTVHLTTAMLLEIPNMAAHPHDIRPKIISRALRRSLDGYEKNYFTGPPESTRDYCVVAARALAKGDWKRTEELLLSLPAWSLLQNSENVKAMLKRKIQEEGLRTYIFTYSPHYTAMSLEELSHIFELPQHNVHSLISKMIINKEIQASWDQPTATLVMHKAQSTRLQLLALQLADKAGVLVENNERLLESAKPGGYGYKFDNKGRGGYDSRRGGGARRGGYSGGYSGERRGGGRGGYSGDRRQGDRRQGGYSNDRHDDRRNVADGFIRQERRGGRRGGRQQAEAGWTNA